MRTYSKAMRLISLVVIVCSTSCSTLEKASVHGFKSGFYAFESEKKAKKVYVDVTEEKIDIYHLTANKPDKSKHISILLSPSDTLLKMPLIFKKHGLDIDISTVLLKYRPPVYGLPAQLNTEFNAAMYAGWRYDKFKITSITDPLGKGYQKINSQAFDIGFFAGPGSAQISSFTTQNNSSMDYSGLIIQTGIAGFIESNIASFGMAVGFDYLLNPDRKIWIYNNKPWVGFIVGIALN